MSSWRIEELDAGETARPRRFVDPMEAVLVVAAIVAAAVVLPRALAPSPITTRVVPTYEQAAASAVPAALTSTLRLSARLLERGTCGALSASTPAPSYGGVARVIARVDASIALGLDPYWWWCVSGARFYDDGVEVVGRFIPIRDATGGPRPRVALRSAELAGQLAGFGSFGPGGFSGVGASDVLRLHVVSDNGRRDAYPQAVAAATSITLRLSSFGGEWGFLRAAGIDRDPAVIATQRGADGDVRVIYLAAVSDFIVRLPLQR